MCLTQPRRKTTRVCHGPLCARLSSADNPASGWHPDPKRILEATAGWLIRPRLNSCLCSPTPNSEVCKIYSSSNTVPNQRLHFTSPERSTPWPVPGVRSQLPSQAGADGDSKGSKEMLSSLQPFPFSSFIQSLPCAFPPSCLPAPATTAQDSHPQTSWLRRA